MKIALFVHCFLPRHFYGTETYTFQIARNLLLMGHSPVVVTAVSPDDPTQPSLVSHYEYEGIPVHCVDTNRLKTERVRDTYFRTEMAPILRGLLAEIRPDLAHVIHIGNHTAALFDVLAEMNVPFVSTLTDFFAICYTSHLQAVDGGPCRGPDRLRLNCLACAVKAFGRNRPHRPLVRWLGNARVAQICGAALRFVHPGRFALTVSDLVDRPGFLLRQYSSSRAVIAPTRFLAQTYAANGLTAPVHQMRFGVDMRREPKLRTASDGKLRFGFIGQLAPHKGTDILIDAFRRIPQACADLDIFGSAREGSDYVDQLKRSAAGYSIRFRGTFDPSEMANILRPLDFLVIPSRWYENSPLVLLNALASHTPVIVSDVEGMTEFVEHGRSGFVFQRGSVDALERVLQDLVRNPEHARSMSADTGYERTTRQMTEELVKIYTTAVGSFSAAHC